MIEFALEFVLGSIVWFTWLGIEMTHHPDPHHAATQSEWGPARKEARMDMSATIHINLDPEAVFDYVMNVPNDVHWRTGVVDAAFTSAGPLGVGSTGFDTIDANGRQMTSTWTVTEVQPQRLARWTLDSGPISGRGGYICEPADNGTRFTLEADVKPTGMYRLLGPIFGAIGRRQNGNDVQRLKDILEQPAE